jgi:hypothetical protein
MLVPTLADCIGISDAEVQRLLSLRSRALLEDNVYLDLIDSLDKEYLRTTLDGARDAYEEGIPVIKREFREAFNFDGSPMSSYTLANWLLGYLEYSGQLTQLGQLHAHIPPEIIKGGLPILLDSLNTMPSGSAAWQRALSILAIPLLVR